MIAVKIPECISEEENLLRTIFSPMHINGKGKPRPACLKPMTKERDEDDPSRMNNKVSVSRLDYAGWQFCLNHARNNQNGSKTFCGFLKLLVKKVRDIGLQVKCKPVEDNPYHANIIFPDIVKPHEDELDELESARIQLTLRNLLNSGQFVSVEEADLLASQEHTNNVMNGHTGGSTENVSLSNSNCLWKRILRFLCLR